MDLDLAAATQWFAANWKIVAAVVALVAAMAANINTILDLFERLQGQKISVSRTLASIPDPGNLITIVNHSATPLLIGHWQIVWARGRPFFAIDEKHVEQPDYGDGETTVEPHGRLRLSFIDANWFSWGAMAHKKDGKLSLKIYLEGRRRARWFHLHTP